MPARGLFRNLLPMPFATNPALDRALTDRGYTELTPVQEAVLEAGAEARDLLVSAQTGSGKTVAYGLAFAPTLLGGEERFDRPGAPRALVIAPTRELAMQVHRELTWLYAQTGARILSCIGGMDGQREGRALEAGCHIVVGTPGRLCDHVARGRLKLGDLAVVVLDEADEMLDLGFRDELDKLLDATPEWRRTLLFSATIAKEITALARKYQKDALRIDTLVRNQPHADIEYRAVRTPPRETEHAVVNVLRYFEAPTALVFCATRDGVRHLHAALQERGFTSVALSGELTQNERTRALQAMRDGQARVCVATDVAARGLDLPDLGLVIHADLPNSKQTLLHRSGRTGRAGKKGTCVLIVPANRARAAETLIASAGVSAQWSGAPLPEEIRARDGKRLLADPVLTDEMTEDDLELARTLLEGRSAEDIAAALVRMYRARLPAPEEMTELSPLPGTRAGPRETHAQGGAQAGAPRPEKANIASGPMVWFSLNIGRAQKADPKWLLPLICRMGGVEKRDVGAIRIQDRETRFEITQAMADDFASNLPDDADDNVRVIRSEAPAATPRREPGAPKRFFKTAPFKKAGSGSNARQRKA
jgi:ATP-dependent RNA helicase DeaD